MEASLLPSDWSPAVAPVEPSGSAFVTDQPSSPTAGLASANAELASSYSRAAYGASGHRPPGAACDCTSCAFSTASLQAAMSALMHALDIGIIEARRLIEASAELTGLSAVAVGRWLTAPFAADRAAAGDTEPS
jgi:hypothetical protein